MIQVGDLLSDAARRSLTLPVSCSVQDAVEQMARNGVEAVVVAEAERPVGMFSGHDLLRLFQQKGPSSAPETDLRAAMTDRILVAAADEDIRRVMVKMLDTGIRHLVVVAEDVIVGQLALCDVVKKMFDVLDGEIRHLNEYIADLHEAGTD
jgi:CBS domain-containing protein